MRKGCRDPNLNYEDLWISNRYCEIPQKNILNLFHIIGQISNCELKKKGPPHN